MKKLAVIFFLCFFLFLPNSFASTITYNNFSDLSAFSLNGASAAINASTVINSNGQSVLRLTNNLSQSSSAFLSNAISLTDEYSFSAFFSFQISNPMGYSDSDGQGADGITFTVQTVSNTAGGGGGGIGYQGITNSVGIEYDTWDNGSWDDYNGNHVGLDLNGNIDSVLQYNISTRMNDGGIWYSWIDYNGTIDSLEVRLSQTNVRPVDAIISYTGDLAAILSSTNAYIGFTSGTGSAGGNHDILSFSFVDTYAPITTTVPEPATLALLGLGLMGLAGISRKKLHIISK